MLELNVDLRMSSMSLVGRLPGSASDSLSPPTALWVKSGNRGNLKCLNVNDHYELIFDRKMFISFLSDAKLLHVFD